MEAEGSLLMGGEVGGGESQEDEGLRTYMLGRLKVDDDQPASTTLGGKWQVPAGPDLEGRAQCDRQVGDPGGQEVGLG